ncbi:MAG: TonB-dependent receptor [Gammaproteobacteria bacterium]|nr:TonB-dependent receptor [Gammaproteobacteria bacterium]
MKTPGKPATHTLLLLLITLTSVPATAADLETLVVSATRSAIPASQLSNSIRTLSSEELEMIGAVHISEALARVPGTWINRGNGQENLTAIRSPVFTGAGSCGAFYVAEDGVPIRPPGVCNVNELSEINGGQAARIEVLRGPGPRCTAATPSTA